VRCHRALSFRGTKEKSRGVGRSTCTLRPDWQRIPRDFQNPFSLIPATIKYPHRFRVQARPSHLGSRPFLRRNHVGSDNAFTRYSPMPKVLHHEIAIRAMRDRGECPSVFRAWMARGQEDPGACPRVFRTRRAGRVGACRRMSASIGAWVPRRRRQAANRCRVWRAGARAWMERGP
jgi:hypothetical protein